MYILWHLVFYWSCYNLWFMQYCNYSNPTNDSKLSQRANDSGILPEASFFSLWELNFPVDYTIFNAEYAVDSVKTCFKMPKRIITNEQLRVYFKATKMKTIILIFLDTHNLITLLFFSCVCVFFFLIISNQQHSNSCTYISRN